MKHPHPPAERQTQQNEQQRKEIPGTWSRVHRIPTLISMVVVTTQRGCRGTPVPWPGVRGCPPLPSSPLYESSRIFLGPEKPDVSPGKQRECRGRLPSAGVWGVPKFLFFSSRRRRRREKEKKKGKWGHPTPRQGEPCTPGCKYLF